MNRQESRGFVYTLEKQIAEAKKIEDSVLREVTLYSLNRQKAQAVNPRHALDQTNLTAIKKAYVNKRRNVRTDHIIDENWGNLDKGECTGEESQASFEKSERFIKQLV